VSRRALLAVAAAAGGLLVGGAVVADTTWGHENLPIPVLRAGAQIGVVDGCDASRHRFRVLFEASLTDEEPLTRADGRGLQALTEGCDADLEDLFEGYLDGMVPR
jgi:hypothetical protein